MKKLRIGTRVEVNGYANQPPHERIVDKGEVLDNSKGYLIKLDSGRENLIFKRTEIAPLPQTWKCSYAYDVPHYADFTVQAVTEEEAEAIIEKALAENKFDGVCGNPDGCSQNSERVFVSGELEEGEESNDETLEQLTKGK